MSRPIKLFFSYSHKDEALRDQLATHLKALQRKNVIDTWHDRKILAGSKWEQDIDDNLNSADIILLLVSPDFLNSDYCSVKELQKAMARHEAGQARVIPVILRPSDWHDEPFAQLQALPKNAKPITTWSDRDEAFLDVVRGIRAAVKALSKRQETETVQKRSVQPQISRPKRSPVTRRQFLNIARFSGVGLGIAAVGRGLQEVGRFFPKSSPSSSPSASSTQSSPEPSPRPVPRQEIPLQSFGFDVVTVNAQGKEIDRQNKQAEYFVEDLGNGVTLEMVSIPAGEFVMGSPESEEKRYNSENPQHSVKVLAFFMGKFEVTQAQWAAVAKLPKVKIDLKPAPAFFKGAKRPVERVSWFEAVEFCDRLSQKTGRLYRLPSEAEWEYACRARTTTPFHFGATITTDLANFDGNSPYASAPKGKYRQQTTNVDSFPPNSFGLYDTHGNVYEWCLDHWHEDYNGAPTDGSAWLSNNEKANRLLRGGSWVSYPWNCRSANRYSVAPEGRYSFIGFRCLCLPSRTPYDQV